MCVSVSHCKELLRAKCLNKLLLGLHETMVKIYNFATDMVGAPNGLTWLIFEINIDLLSQLFPESMVDTQEAPQR